VDNDLGVIGVEDAAAVERHGGTAGPLLTTLTA
jgi:hypothetical protein